MQATFVHKINLCRRFTRHCH